MLPNVSFCWSEVPDEAPALKAVIEGPREPMFTCATDSSALRLAIVAGRSHRSEYAACDSKGLTCRRGRLARKHYVNRCLGAFLAVRAGDPHRADHLAVHHNRQCAVLREVVHEGRR